MAYGDEIQRESLIHSHTKNRDSIFRWKTRRKVMMRRRKPLFVRLGGKKKRRRGYFMVRLLRRIKLKWLKLQYSCMLKKLKNYYDSMVKDLTEAGATLESLQQRILLETYFTVPLMGVSSTASMPSYFDPQSGKNRVR